jgi:hypothetical protein
MLAPSLAVMLLAQPGEIHRTSRKATVAKEPGHRGEREVSRKTIAQGKPE